MAGQRRAELVSIPLAPGVLSNTTPRGAKVRVNYMTWDRWYDVNYVRWHKGLAEKIGGWAYQPMVDTGGNSVTYDGLARGLHDWASLDGLNWIAIGTHQKLYLVQPSGVNTLYDITPVRYVSNVGNAFSTQNGSNVVTITDALNGAQDGDFVIIQDATSVGGILLAGSYEISFVDVNTYTVVAAATASSTATGGGNATLTYQISIGLPSDGELLGYGTWEYGESTYGTARPVGDGVYARLRSWSLDNYGEDLIASYSDGEIYWWQRSQGGNSVAALLDSTAPTGVQRVLVDVSQRVIIALGCTDVTSAYDPLLVRWCDLDDITVWIPTDTNIAGDYPLTIGSRLVTGIRSKGQNLIWTDKHLYRMVLTGGTGIYSFYGAGNTQILGPNAAVDVDGVAYWIGFDNFYNYSGTIELLPCDVWETVFDPSNSTSIDLTQPEKCYAFALETKTEITWLYQSISSTGDCDRYVTYNWDDEVWYYGAWNRTAAQGNSPAMLGGYPYGVNGGYLYQHEVGTDAVEATGTAAIPWYMESLDITTGGAKSEYTMGGSDARFAIGGSDSHLRVVSMIPDFKRMTGTANITLKTKERPQQANYTVNGPVSFGPDDVQIDIDAHDSQIRIRLDNYTGNGSTPLPLSVLVDPSGSVSYRQILEANVTLTSSSISFPFPFGASATLTSDNLMCFVLSVECATTALAIASVTFGGVACSFEILASDDPYSNNDFRSLVAVLLPCDSTTDFANDTFVLTTQTSYSTLNFLNCFAFVCVNADPASVSFTNSAASTASTLSPNWEQALPAISANQGDLIIACCAQAIVNPPQIQVVSSPSFNTEPNSYQYGGSPLAISHRIAAALETDTIEFSYALTQTLGGQYSIAAAFVIQGFQNAPASLGSSFRMGIWQALATPYSKR